MSSVRSSSGVWGPLFAIVVPVFAVVACQGGLDEEFEEGDSNLDAAGLVCAAKPVPRTYAFFDGTKIDDKRADESFDANRARFKPFGVMADEYKRVLGVVPASLAGAAATFDEPPPRWFSESIPSSVTLNAVYGIGLEGCTSSMGSSPERAKAPTADTATKFCTDMMQKAWGEAPGAPEVASCVALATTKLAGEPDARKRWSHVCATILSSSQFLTF